jgi:hypothetical protein
MAVPTLVQSVHTGLDTTGGFGTHFPTFKIELPNDSLPNNLLVVAFQYFSGISVTSVTDNKGNTWVNFSSTLDSTSSTRYDIYYVAGALAGTRRVTIAWGAQGGFLSANLSEWYNVATTTPTNLGSATSNDTTSPYNAGSFTTTVDGDLVLCYAFGQGGGSGTLTGFVAGAGFTLMAADIQAGGLNQGNMAMYQVQPTQGAINPQFTTTGNTTGAYDICAVAFKSASAGTAPSLTPRVTAVQHQYTGTTIPASFQFPCPAGGNLVVGLFLATNVLINALTDSAGNVWQFPASAKVNSTTEAAQVVYAANAATSPTLKSLAITYDGVAIGDPLIIWCCVVGAAPVPFDVGAAASGTQNVDATLDGVTIDPNTIGGIIFAVISIFRRTLNGVTVSGQDAIFDGIANAGLDNVAGGSSNSPLDEDAGGAHIYNTVNTPVTFSWTYVDIAGTPGTGDWACAAAAFKGVPIPPHKGGHLSQHQRRAG